MNHLDILCFIKIYFSLFYGYLVLFIIGFCFSINSQRNSYMPSYDNSVGYQTYVVNNKQPPPDV